MRFCKAASVYRDCGYRRGNACKCLEGDLATIDAVFAVDRSARKQAHDLVAKGSVFKN